MGIFIEIDVNQNEINPALAQRLVTVCPVDIFATDGARLVVRPEAVDECTLCELCLAPAPAGAIVIRKLYSGQQLVSRGPAAKAGQGEV